MISFATVKGTICVYSIDLSAQPQATTSQIDGPMVTCFYWTSDEKHLYFGDRKGNVSMINITFFMVCFLWLLLKNLLNFYFFVFFCLGKKCFTIKSSFNFITG